MKKPTVKTLVIATSLALGAGMNVYAADKDAIADRATKNSSEDPRGTYGSNVDPHSAEKSSTAKLKEGSSSATVDGRSSASREGSGSVGQFVDDATVTARVKARFAEDPSVSALRVKVDTTKGIVELSGTAASDAEKNQAAAIARGVPDVRGVRNNIAVRSGSSSTPASSTR